MAAFRANDRGPFVLFPFFDHKIMLTFRTLFPYGFVPRSEFTFGILAAAVKRSSLFGATRRNFPLAVLLGAGNTQADGFGKFTFRIGRAGNKFSESAHFDNEWRTALITISFNLIRGR